MADKTTTTANISEAQRKREKKARKFVDSRIGRGATALPFSAAADQNELFNQAFLRFTDAFNDTNQSQGIRQSLEDILSGKGVHQSDVARVSEEFNQNITTPVTNILRETLGVDTQNQLNQPGRLFASDTGENVGRAITQELGRSTAPFLAQSLENERNRGFASQEAFLARQQGAVSALQALPTTEFQQAFGVAGLEQQNRQQDVNIRAQDFLRRSAENDPFLRLALGVGTTGLGSTVLTETDQGSNIGAGIGTVIGAAYGGFKAGPEGAAVGGAVGGAGGGVLDSLFD